MNRTTSAPGSKRLSLCALALATLFAAPLVHAQTPDFGPNVYIFDPSTPVDQITTVLSNGYFQGLGPTDDPTQNQFSTQRYAVLFKPGTYTVQAPIGYYTSVAGLGKTPAAVTIDGFITPNYGQNPPYTNVTTTFWRSEENLTINPAQNNAQYAAPDTFQWGVSQGAPLRRVQINGDLDLTDTWCGYASGGFVSDSNVTGNVNPCSQQQWYTRNSTIGSWSGGVWNMVFSGVIGAPPQAFPSITTLASTPASREKPFLYVDDNGKYNVFVPAVQHNGSGTTWTASNMGAGHSLPIGNFFIAKPTNTAAEINLALAFGKSLILTPGIYKLDRSLNVLYPNTVVLGMGYATLVPQKGTAALTVADVDGVSISGLIIDAGPVNSPVLFQIGAPRNSLLGALLGLLFPGHAANPMSVNDVTVRIGGATAGMATTSIEVNSNDVILDNIWAWRADHGNGVGWTLNTADHGLVVNGNNVIATGLAVEHYQKEQVLWNGNGGETIFYQSELPYDPPSQAAWMDGSANGYPSYVVSDNVKTHTAWGLGIYSYFNQGIDIIEDNAMIVPDTANIAIHDAGTVFLTGSGQITHVIDNTGATVSSANGGSLSPVILFP